jgi:two-component system, response regulator RpfG
VRSLSSIPAPLPIEDQLRSIHESLRRELPGIVRTAVARYDYKTDALKTYAHSTVDGASPLTSYEATLGSVPSLGELALSRADRVIADMSELAGLPSLHSRVLADRYGSSFTRPLFDGDRLRGFVFFDADAKGYFTPDVVLRVGVYTELISLLLTNHFFPARVLRSAAYMAVEMSHARDPETGAHLDRVARYARLVAIGVAEAQGLSDVFIEHLFDFAPLHDVGKVAIPDAVLLKQGRLTDDEYAIMKTHVTRGVELVDRLLGSLGAQSLRDITLIRNIVKHHHEAWNGSGYPDGLAGRDIPIEARIVMVADVFDALTSLRSYKRAWTMDEAFAHLAENAGKLFDPDCVAALTAAREKVEAIGRTFRDDPDPSP